MTQQATEAPPADDDAPVVALMALTDEELAVLGASDDIGVLPIWMELTPEQQEMGARTAFRGLVARGLVAMPTVAQAKAIAGEGPEDQMEISVREDLTNLLAVRKGSPAKLAVARTASGGQDFLYGHVMGDDALVEEVAGEGVHEFVLTHTPEAFDSAFVEGLIHPDAVDGQGDQVSFDAATEPPPSFIEKLGEAHLRSDVVLRRVGDDHPPLVGIFSGPDGTWLMEATAGAAGSVTATPVSVDRAREKLAELSKSAREAAVAALADIAEG